MCRSKYLHLQFATVAAALAVSESLSRQNVQHEYFDTKISVAPCDLVPAAHSLLYNDQHGAYNGEFIAALDAAMSNELRGAETGRFPSAPPIELLRGLPLSENLIHQVAQRLLAQIEPGKVARIRALTVQMLHTMRAIGVPREVLAAEISAKLVAQARTNPALAFITVEITADAIAEVYG